MNSLVAAMLEELSEASIGLSPREEVRAAAARIAVDNGHDPSFTVADLARLANVSPSYLWRVFKEGGSSPSRVLREARLDRFASLDPGSPAAVRTRQARFGSLSALYRAKLNAAKD